MTLDCAISRMSYVKSVSVFQNHPFFNKMFCQNPFCHDRYVCGCCFEGLSGLHRDPLMEKIAFIYHYIVSSQVHLRKVH